MTLDFYYIDASPPCRANLMLAREIGLELNLKRVDLLSGEHLQPEYLKINPNHTVPTLIDDDLVLGDSHAISIYLVDKHAPNHQIYPQDMATRAKINRFLFFNAGTLFPVTRGAIVHMIFHGAEAPSAEALEEFQVRVAILDTFLEGKKYLVGENRTLADLTLYATLNMTVLFDYDYSVVKNVDSWLKRLRDELSAYDEEVNEKPVAELKAVLLERRGAAARS